ncbi:class I SAM-dependent methyltransferase [Pseudovibrio brasiliensis]|uniref:Class I SAM-dependent methyltransferase n=1 Tax=Pseudovibrio brasiliensis TaxID=1898042 RepID=A0ABX8AWW6_9HYPH|nr:class I SAM-dependent methyltransferase [Pseudovibrio brasiliensis]QUS58251.1 class I SAM-dependent methyltransferase [Pseudovibrio brasiliensis]
MTVKVTASLDNFELGKKAALDGEIDKARDFLRPIADANPYHPAAFFLCQIESRKGILNNCDKYCLTFLSKHPQHAGMRTISALLHIAKGDLRQAEVELKIALNTNPKHRRALNIHQQVVWLRRQEEARNALEIITAAEASKLTKLKAARRLKKICPADDWDNHELQAKVAYFHNSVNIKQSLKSFEPELIEKAVELGYCTWPKKIQRHVKGKHVLDVGCGFGGYAFGYLCAGAKSYTGIDPAMSLSEKRMRNKRIRQWVEVPRSAQEIASSIEDIELLQTSTHELLGQNTYDVVCLHNVTEHLLDIKNVFSDIAKLLAKNGKLIFLHHNFYGWSGHHMTPHNPSVLDTKNPEHLKFCDWNHISIVEDLPADHYLHTNLNQLRIGEMQKLTEDFFKIKTWELRPSPDSVLKRLTPEIIEKIQGALPDFTTEELETNAVFCIANAR